MEFRVLKYFLMVAREENITKAASALHVTQPTLSRQLMQLEEELGVKLFKRGNHNIVLTEEGLLLKRRAQEIVSLVEKTQNEFLKEEELSGEIAIGSGEIKGMSTLAKAMESFHSIHSLVRFDIYSGNADNIKEKIENGLLDMGLLLEPVDIGRYNFIRLLTKERWGIMVREDSPLAKKEVVIPEDLKDQLLIVTKRAIVQNELVSWFGDYSNGLKIISTYNLIYNAVMQVKAGLGVLLCIELEAHYDGVKFIPLSPELELGSVLVWKKNKTLSPTMEKFIEHCKRQLHKGKVIEK